MPLHSIFLEKELGQARSPSYFFLQINVPETLRHPFAIKIANGGREI